MDNLSKKIIGVVVVLALVVIGGAWWWKKDVNNSGNLGAVGQVGQTNTPAANEPVSVTVADQFPGSLIFVSAVELPRGGWVVIRRDEGGAPGEVVGAGYFGPGVLTGEVNLSTATKEGEKYYAVLHHDNDNLNFEPEADPVYRDATGQLVMVSFTVTENLPERKG